MTWLKTIPGFAALCAAASVYVLLLQFITNPIAYLLLCAPVVGIIAYILYLSLPPPRDITADLLQIIVKENLPVPTQHMMDVIVDAGRQMLRDAPVDVVLQSLTAYLRALPKLSASPLHISFYEQAPLSHVIHDMIAPFRTLPNSSLLKTFDQNALGVTMKEDSREILYPQDYKGTREEIVAYYLKNTPLQQLFCLAVPYPFEDKMRFEHTWIIANSGHGKTQTLQHLLVYDLPRVVKGEISLIIFDPMDALVEKLLEAEAFAPGGSLHDRLVLIDPKVLAPAINLFQIGDSEHALQMYKFLFGALLDSEMTPNQATLFENCALLLSRIPNATFMDFYRLLRGQDYSHHYDKLDEIGRNFFEHDFSQKGVDGYEGTRKQIIRRLNTLMRTYPFSAMFQQTENKITFGGINEGKIYLVNASISKLTDAGSRLFARFFLLLASNAVAQRQAGKEMPCFIYLDEADQFVRDDQIVKSLLARARQKNVGLVLAHRTLDEIGTSVASSLEGIASIVMAGGLRGGDLAYMSRVMGCEPNLLQGPKHTFAVSMRGKRTVQIEIPPGTIDKLPKMGRKEQDAMKAVMVERYGITQPVPVVAEVDQPGEEIDQPGEIHI